jgi:hypothetical protein
LPMRFPVGRDSLSAGVSSDHSSPTLNIDGGVVVPVENETTGRTYVFSVSEAFRNEQTAPGAFLCGFARLDKDERLTGSLRVQGAIRYIRDPAHRPPGTSTATDIKRFAEGINPSANSPSKKPLLRVPSLALSFKSLLPVSFLPRSPPALSPFGFVLLLAA